MLCIFLMFKYIGTFWIFATCDDFYHIVVESFCGFCKHREINVVRCYVMCFRFAWHGANKATFFVSCNLYRVQSEEEKGCDIMWFDISQAVKVRSCRFSHVLLNCAMQTWRHIQEATTISPAGLRQIKYADNKYIYWIWSYLCVLYALSYSAAIGDRFCLL